MTKAQIEEAAMELFYDDNLTEYTRLVLLDETFRDGILWAKAAAIRTLPDVVDILCRKLGVKE